MTQQQFNVQGMTCAHCERAVTQAVLGLDPRAEVRVDLAAGTVLVGSDKPAQALAQAIRDEGYTVAGPQ